MLEPLFLRVAERPAAPPQPVTIRLPVAPLSTFFPLTGTDDEAAVYLEAVVYTLDAERSEMWLCHQHRRGILADVARAVVASYAPRPIVLALCNGHAVCVLGAAPGLRVEDATSREIVAT